jgi:hypothetical protein
MHVAVYLMVGEVWVDSGQSNMEFALRGAPDGPEAAAAAGRHRRWPGR